MLGERLAKHAVKKDRSKQKKRRVHSTFDPGFRGGSSSASISIRKAKN